MNFNYYWPIALIVLSNIFYHISSKSTPDNINPFASLTITYLVCTLASTVMYFSLNRGGNLLQEYRNLNWTSLVLGLAVVGLDVGTIYMYKAGWNMSVGQLVHSAILAVCLVIIGCIFFKEQITPSKIAGILLCMGGIYFLNR